MSYNFYIDKKLNNLNENFINIKLDYPIILNENETAKIKVLNVQYLNNIYNVSSFLQNNIISLIKTPVIYNVLNITSQAGQEININLSNEFYDLTLLSVDKLKDTTIKNYDDVTKIFTLENTNYKLYYKSDDNYNVITQGYDPFFTNANYNNIFINDPLAKLQFNEYQNYIILENKNNLTDFLKKVSYAIDYDGSVSLNYNVLINLIINGSNDGINYENIETLIPNMNSIEFNSGTGSINKSKLNIYYNTSNPYKYYKLYLSTNIVEAQTSLQNAFKLNYLELNKANYDLSYTTQPPITYNLVIPDGYYKVSNYITTLNNLLEPHFIKVDLSNINNKISFKSYSIPPEQSYNVFDDNFNVYLMLNTLNIRENIGIENDIILLPRGGILEANKNIDLINFKKLILSTNLKFKKNTHNEFIGGNDITTGIGDVLLWIDADEPPLTCVKYKNYENSYYDIDDKIINNIIIKLHNEKRQPLYLDNMLIHLQISVRKVGK